MIYVKILYQEREIQGIEEQESGDYSKNEVHFEINYFLDQLSSKITVLIAA